MVTVSSMRSRLRRSQDLGLSGVRMLARTEAGSFNCRTTVLKTALFIYYFIHSENIFGASSLCS